MRRRLHTVNPRQIGTEIRVIGIEEIEEVAVIPHQMLEQLANLFRHVVHQLVAEFGEQPAIANRGAKAIETQPLREKFIERGPGALIAQHALRLLFDASRLGKLVVFRRRKKRFIGHGVPQEIGKAARDAVVFGAAIRAALQMKEEVRRLQHRLHNHLLLPR